MTYTLLKEKVAENTNFVNYMFLDKTWTILTFYLKVCIEICYMIKLF